MSGGIQGGSPLLLPSSPRKRGPSYQGDGHQTPQRGELGPGLRQGDGMMAGSSRGELGPRFRGDDGRSAGRHLSPHPEVPALGAGLEGAGSKVHCGSELHSDGASRAAARPPQHEGVVESRSRGELGPRFRGDDGRGGDRPISPDPEVRAGGEHRRPDHHESSITLPLMGRVDAHLGAAGVMSTASPPPLTTSHKGEGK
jgi:hypothetical protein